MELTNFNDTVFRLYLYADATKMIHYTTDKNHEHELCDTIRDTILDFVDELAEQYYGYQGKPSYSSFTKLSDLDINETDDLAQLCKSASDLVDMLRSEAEKDSKLGNIVSLIDDYKGKMNKNLFLCTFDKISGK